MNKQTSGEKCLPDDICVQKQMNPFNWALEFMTSSTQSNGEDAIEILMFHSV